MLSAAINLFTPGNGQASRPIEDEGVDLSSPPATPQLAQDDVVTVSPGAKRRQLRSNLFVTKDPDSDSDSDHKHDTVEPPVQVKSRFTSSHEEKHHQPAVTRSRSLPKIVYSKLVTLTLSNFSEFREGIKVTGYARGWPLCYRDPSLTDLSTPWSGVDGDTVDDEIRREAFMVLYQTISAFLLYLVEDVRSGDVIALWNILYNRFLHVTAASLKLMKREWESLSQGSSKIDEFISMVSSKAKSMRMVGIVISDQDKAIALLHGLNKDFDWIKNYYSTNEDYTFADVATASLKQAVDRHLLSTSTAAVKSSSAGNSSDKEVCYNFNSDKGCTRKSCSYRHEKVSKEALKTLKSKIKKKTKKSEAPILYQGKSGTKPGYCYKCFSKDHVIADCPLKKQINEYIKSLSTAPVSANPVLPLSLAIFSVSVKPDVWILDSGAAYHITNNFAKILDPVTVPRGTVAFTVGNDHVMSPTYIGTIKLGNLSVSNVYFCAECPVSIVSESKLLLAGVDITKTASSKSTVVAYKGTPIMSAVVTDGIFVITHAIDADSKLSGL